MLPENTAQCMRLIEGQYFEGEGGDHVAMFKRTPDLRSLEISFFPSFMLFYSTRLADMMQPLAELSNDTAVIVRLPKMFSMGEKTPQGLPLPGQLNDGAWYSLRRPLMERGDTDWGCKAYKGFL